MCPSISSSDPDTMTITALEAIASSSGKEIQTVEVVIATTPTAKLLTKTDRWPFTISH